jgi:predicted nucleic acid-binding protein
MRVDLVIDASVAAKFYFHEDGSDQARALLTSGAVTAAPDLLFIEMAAVATKQVRRGLATPEAGRDAVVSVGDLIDKVAPSRALAARAFAFAWNQGVSAHDGAYLALAEQLGAPMVTADLRLVERARAFGGGALVRPL